MKKFVTKGLSVIIEAGRDVLAERILTDRIPLSARSNRKLIPLNWNETDHSDMVLSVIIGRN